MKAILCQFKRKTCMYAKGQKSWLPELLAKEYRRRKLVKFVVVDGSMFTKSVGPKFKQKTGRKHSRA